MTKKLKPTMHSCKDEGTNILEANERLDSQYPFCALPPNFFERALYLQRRKSREVVEGEQGRTLFSVQTWDGREIFKVSAT